MSTLYNQVMFEWLDVNSQPSVNFWGTIDQTPGAAANYAALAAATQALSDAALTHIIFQQVLTLSATPLTGPYQSVFDRAAFLLRYQGIRQSAQMQVPAPKESILTPNHELVDMSNPDVQAWMAQMQTFIASSSGQVISQFIKGWRTRAGGN